MSEIERLRALLAANANPDPEHPDPDSIWVDLADSAILALPALLDALDELVAMIPEAYCVFDRFETCGDPFCSEARDRRDAILARLEGAS